ncbi:hypothetical protein D1007_16027 [Hordeum vulgare]|nr:hypothetical protein D1007_16027 [Hordeum vulgare]
MSTESRHGSRSFSQHRKSPSPQLFIACPEPSPRQQAHSLFPKFQELPASAMAEALPLASAGNPSPRISFSLPSSSAASTGALGAATFLRSLGEALLERHHGRLSATTSPRALVALRFASGDPVTTPGCGEEQRSPCARRPALPRPLVVGFTRGPAPSVLRREVGDEPRRKERKGRERERKRDRAGPVR